VRGKILAFGALIRHSAKGGKREKKVFERILSFADGLLQPKTGQSGEKDREWRGRRH